jgi:hypothetical protein
MSTTVLTHEHEGCRAAPVTLTDEHQGAQTRPEAAFGHGTGTSVRIVAEPSRA